MSENSLIKIDLCSDLEQIANKILLEKGYSKEEISKQKESCLFLYNKWWHNHLVPKKRKVIISNECNCPKEYSVAFKKFINDVEMGHDLTKYMSKNVAKLNYNDDLLNDWGVRHFHLSCKMSDKTWVKRSNYLIFAYCQNNEMYILKILSHKAKILWNDEDFIRIIRRCWPHILSKYILSEVELTAECDTLMLRKANVMPLTSIDNFVSFPLGGGYASDGSSLKVVRETDNLNNKLAELEMSWKTQYDNIVQVIKIKKNSEINKKLKFVLKSIIENVAYILELNNSIMFKVPLNGSSVEMYDTVDIIKQSIHNIKAA